MDNLSLKRKKRMGFTLVELLVVIAILAVLASVSVIGYLSFVKKARVSNDVSLTTQMNTVLASNEVVDGKNATPYDAISELDEDGGFDVNKISPTANGYFFGFDTTDNRMVLFDEGMNVVAPEGKSVDNHKRDVFLLVGTEDEMKDSKYSAYSFYLKNGFVESGDNVINVSTGVDTGTNEIGTVNYTSTAGQEVLIRTGTFNTKVNVNAPNDTVKHYGYAYIVNIGKIADASYHENGTVGRIEVEQGHAVLEAGSVVVCPMLENNNETEATITVKEGAKVYNEGNYNKDENGVATGHVEDCGAGHHNFGEKIIIDSKYMYEICKCCGYTLISVQDSNGNQVKQTKNTIDPNTKKVADEVATPVETYLVSGIVNENPSDETISNYTISGDPIVETPKIDKELDQSTCDHEFNEGVITVAPTCTATGVKTYTCTKCGETYSITVAKAAHKYYDNIGGVHTSTEKCSVCGHERGVYVAQIGENTYTTLTDAINAVQTNNTQTKITLINDDAIEGNEGWVIQKNQNILLDLNGYTLKNLVTTAAASKVIHNKGNLVIKDSSDVSQNGTGTGKIYCQAATEYTGSWPTWNWATNTILNDAGSLIVYSGTIECNINGGLGYAVDTSSNIGNALFTLNGGRLIGRNADQAVRVFANSSSYTSIFDMNGGVIESGGFWLQEPGDSSTKAEIKITGGEVNGMIDLCCLNANEQKVEIAGDAVIKADTFRIRKYSNSRLCTDNSNAAQTNDCFVKINCKSFTCTQIDNKDANISDQRILKNLINISSTTEVSDNLLFLRSEN